MTHPEPLSRPTSPLPLLPVLLVGCPEAAPEGGGPIIDCALDGNVDDPEQFVSVVAACNPAQGTDWVLGGGHTIATVLGARRAPRLILDDAIDDAPVAIMEQSSHSTWVNSRAVELLGIDATTPNPQGGLILEDPSGEPNGILVDAAGEWPWEAALAPSPALDQLNREALRAGIAGNSAVGITSAVDARTDWQRGYLDAHTPARDAGELTVRMVLSLWASPASTCTSTPSATGRCASRWTRCRRTGPTVGTTSRTRS